MSLKATVKVGKACNISLEAADPVSLIKAVSQFTQLPSKCGHCKSDNLQLMHRASGDKSQYDYLHMKCGDCGAQGDIGQNETPKGNVFFKFQPKDRINVKDGFYKYWEQGDKAGTGGGGNTQSRDSGQRETTPHNFSNDNDAEEDDIQF